MAGQVSQPASRPYLFLTLIGLIFIAGLAITFNREQLIRYKSDFFQRWYATTKLLNEGRNLYDARNGTEALQIVYGDGPKPYSETNFYYPAHLLLFILPLALLPYQPAHLLWTILVQIFLVAGLTAVMRTWRWPGSVLHMLLYFTAVFLSVPYIQHTIWGQFNSIGILGLGLTLAMLSRQRYGWGGIFAVGLTFKPHTTLITLAFLLLWALVRQERRRFLIGFVLASLACWGVAELAQPGWVVAFIQSVKGYSAAANIDIPAQSNLAKQTIAILATGAALALFWKHRLASILSPAFAGCLALSAALSAFIVPITGMFHTLIFPLVLIPLLVSWQTISPRRYRLALFTFIAIYFLGWLGFLGGFWAGSGMNITWAEAAYKTILPFLIIGWALPLCFIKQTETQSI